MAACGGPQSSRPPERAEASFTHGGVRLRVEAVREDLVHFELAAASTPASAPIAVSPMIADAGAPIAWTRHDATTFETRELRVEVDPDTLCVKVTDTQRNFLLHRLCPRETARDVTITRGTTQNVYGLGEQFLVPGTPDGDWLGRKRTPGNEHGNAMVKFDGGPHGTGSNGNAQFPILYALGPARQAYAMFVDDASPETWDFTGDPWTLHTASDALRWYVMAGPDLADLRRDYMRLVGHAPVPPKQAFGLWISEYGFDTWHELEDKLRTLRAHHFPVDGFVMDLQWFGNVSPRSETSRMGTLGWDREHFPEPEAKLKELHEREGIALVLIEESYVSRGLHEHAELAAHGYLARDCEHCPPTFISNNPWWGVGGMIDWSNPAAADYWHDTKRQPLVDMGVLGHWCDLGEPEMYSEKSWYAYGAHRDVDVHDLFSWFWVESIARGYARHHVERRPFMMARSGAPGIQRFGGSMWSGDIGSNLTTLATHLNAQMNMSLSGIDYFGADIGGFIREAARGDLGDTYTQWFADGMAIDVPGRVHTWNTENNRETAPDRVGHLASNLASARRRYELVPYVYSLAHRAWLAGDPVFPPLVWAFPEDPQARTLGGEKLIGSDVLVTMTATDGARTVDVYLPRGTSWYELDGNRELPGGQRLTSVALYDAAGVLHLPMFARAGAIVPMAFVDDATFNTLGKRGDGTHHDELRVVVFPGDDNHATSFTLYEDDGETLAYQRGDVRTTEITQVTDPAARAVTVKIAPARGSYAGAPARRDAIVEVVLAASPRPKTVTLDGAPLPECTASATRCWTVVRPGRVRIDTGEAAVETAKTVGVTY
jgi:alpha-glucosidase